MTLLLTIVTPLYVVHVSDRLVTRAGVPFDAASNKDLIVYANDAIATIAYSRVAFLGGVPTDLFIARVVAGDHIANPPPAVTFRAPAPDHWPDLGLLASRVQRAIQAEVERTRMSPDRVPEVVISGWKWKPGRGKQVRRSLVKPVSWFLRYERGAVRFRRATLDPLYPWWLSAVPTGSFSDAYARSVMATISNWGNAELDRGRLIAAVRRYASESGGRVGTDLMVITVPRPPNFSTIEVRFEPDPMQGDGPRPGLSELGSFSPWVIGPAKTVAPIEFMGMVRVPLGPYFVEMSGPPGAPLDLSADPGGPPRCTFRTSPRRRQ